MRCVRKFIRGYVPCTLKKGMERVLPGSRVTDMCSLKRRLHPQLEIVYQKTNTMRVGQGNGEGAAGQQSAYEHVQISRGTPGSMYGVRLIREGRGPCHAAKYSQTCVHPKSQPDLLLEMCKKIECKR